MTIKSKFAIVESTNFYQIMEFRFENGKLIAPQHDEAFLRWPKSRGVEHGKKLLTFLAENFPAGKVYACPHPAFANFDRLVDQIRGELESED